MKVSLIHPNGDIFTWDLDAPHAADDLAGTLEFELEEGGAKWVGICRGDVSESEVDEIGNRVQSNL